MGEVLRYVLTGKGMLGNGDPADVVYSFTLLERGENVNYLRLQTDKSQIKILVAPNG